MSDVPVLVPVPVEVEVEGVSVGSEFGFEEFDEELEEEELEFAITNPPPLPTTHPSGTLAVHPVKLNTRPSNTASRPMTSDVSVGTR